MTQLIGICGSIGAGKSTVAKHLAAAHKGKRVRVADALKQMLRTLGLTEEQVDGYEKAIPLALLGGKTPRDAMQTLGTEWGRKLMHPDLWINACVMRITTELVQKDHDIIIVDDIRFPNEAKAIHEMGGQLWLVRRPEVEPDMSFSAKFKRLVRAAPRVHTSELLWQKLPVDQVLMNTGDEAALKEAATALLNFARGDCDGPAEN